MKLQIILNQHHDYYDKIWVQLVIDRYLLFGAEPKLNPKSRSARLAEGRPSFDFVGFGAAEAEAEAESAFSASASASCVKKSICGKSDPAGLHFGEYPPQAHNSCACQALGRCIR